MGYIWKIGQHQYSPPNKYNFYPYFNTCIYDIYIKDVVTKNKTHSQ